MKHVSVTQMVAEVRNNVKGTSHITVNLDSPQDKVMRKTGNPFIGMGIVKRETLNGTIGYIYENAVNNIALKEDKEIRQAKPHPWGDMDEKHLFRINRKTGKPYLSMLVKNVTVHGYFDGNGNQIDKNLLAPFMPEKHKSSTQADLDGEAVVRDYDMQNITSIRAFSEDYIITTTLTAPQTAPQTETVTENA